ncbi:MAG TPA: DUF2812 domain-containing protein [Bacillaceae bacterium]|nr:DUF2812 domain-containing protein [Bacillaceae bacterium]
MIKKFKFFLASNVDKEEKWLIEMSSKGFHFKKYKAFMYYFEEDKNKSYIYQTDFNEPTDDYFQLYEDAGWEYVDSAVVRFHYFRTDANNTKVKKIYSDSESIKETYQRMLKFYLLLFFVLLTSQVWLFTTWRGDALQIIVLSIVGAVILLYVYLFISLKRKINFYTRKL